MLVAHALFVRKKYYEVVDFCQDLELNFPMLFNEKIDVKYLMAECYFMMKNYFLAKEIYSEVVRIDSSYRLARDRLKAIENIK